MDNFEPAEIINSEEQIQEMIADLKKNFPDRADKAEELVRNSLEQDKKECLFFVNDTYQVLVRKVKQIPIADCDIAWLSIKRIDRETIHDWRDLQDIKNQIIGLENEAIEIYPAESRLVDTSNQYHLWVFLDSEFRFPLGFNERLVSDISIGNSKQRSFGTPVNIRVSKKIKRQRGVLKKKK